MTMTASAIFYTYPTQRLCAKKVPLVMLLQEGELTFEDLLLPPHTPSHVAQTSGRPAEVMADLEHSPGHAR